MPPSTGGASSSRQSMARSRRWSLILSCRMLFCTSRRRPCMRLSCSSSMSPPAPLPSLPVFSQSAVIMALNSAKSIRPSPLSSTKSMIRFACASPPTRSDMSDAVR